MRALAAAGLRDAERAWLIDAEVEPDLARLSTDVVGAERDARLQVRAHGDMHSHMRACVCPNARALVHMHSRIWSSAYPNTPLSCRHAFAYVVICISECAAPIVDVLSRMWSYALPNAQLDALCVWVEEEAGRAGAMVEAAAGPLRVLREARDEKVRPARLAHMHSRMRSHAYPYSPFSFFRMRPTRRSACTWL